MSQNPNAPPVVLEAVITDANGIEIGLGHNGIDWNEQFLVDSKLDDPMIVSPQRIQKNNIFLLSAHNYGVVAHLNAPLETGTTEPLRTILLPYSLMKYIFP